MRLLLIDNSNSRTKLCLSIGETIVEESIRRLPTADLTAQQLKDFSRDFQPDACIVCSVVPEKARLIEEAINTPFHSLDFRSPLGIGIDYPKPEKIGADRLANAAACATHYGSPAIVVDFGTAVTFDVLDRKKGYVGGVIAPGLAAMNDYLARKTALLPTIDPHEPDRAIGRSTEEAMHAGAVFGYRGLVREILTKIEEELPSKPRIIATGGDASLIARDIDRIEAVDRHLTLEGLRLVGTRVFQKN